MKTRLFLVLGALLVGCGAADEVAPGPDSMSGDWRALIPAVSVRDTGCVASLREFPDRTVDGDIACGAIRWMMTGVRDADARGLFRGTATAVETGAVSNAIMSRGVFYPMWINFEGALFDFPFAPASP